MIPKARTVKSFLLLLAFSTFTIVHYEELLYGEHIHYIKRIFGFGFKEREQEQEQEQDEIYTKSIELTIRMPLNKEMINRFMCDLMRSSVMFWDHNYGDVVIILDEEDKVNDDFTKKLNSTLPFNFRVVYEKAPSDPALIEKVAKRNNRPYGYYRMFYSSFLMDLYAKPNSIIAWADTDVVFTMPAMKETIFRNGRLIVKGANTFKFNWVKNWAKTTSIALGGLPMIADFMTYFPAYIYPSTIRNCREYILKTLKVKSMEQALDKLGVTSVSPVCILFSYAYFFERDLYEWHIDIASVPLDNYNRQYSIMNHSLTINDTLPELHQTIHRRHYTTKEEPLKQAICFLYVKIGRKTYPSTCEQFKGKTNWQLFEFQSIFKHRDTWCNGPNEEKCISLIDNSYQTFQQKYENKLKYLNLSKIGLVEDLLFMKNRFKCPSLGI